MFENLETNEVENEQVVQPESDEPTEAEVSTEKVNVEEVAEADEVIPEPSSESEDEQRFDFFVDAVKNIVKNREKIIQDINEKREYLMNNLAEYDNENYLQNDAFKTLYSQAFNALGTKLDTPKFIELIENYVNSRLEANNRKLSAIKENEKITDSFEFEKGVSAKPEKTLRMQDIPPEELEQYIYKYV